MFDTVRWIIGTTVGVTFGKGTAAKETAEPFSCAGCSCMARSPAHLQLFGVPGQRELTVCSHSSVLGAVWGQLEEKCTSAPCLLQELNQTGGGLGCRSGLSGVPQYCRMLRWRKLSWAWGRALQKVSPSLHRPNPRPFTSNGWNLLKA